jgi:trans-aconitate 2-methyltransferase
MSWDPDAYLKYSNERLRPALDLLARIDVAAPTTVVDIGCGAGNVTALLAQRWPRARIVGVDNSREMLAKARASTVGVIPAANGSIRHLRATFTA